MNGLKYGNPPDIKDCTDIGTVPEAVAPKKITNQGVFANQEDMIKSVYGMEIPPLRRAWMVVSHFKPGTRSGDIPVPYSVRVPGLGTLVYGNDDPYNGDNWGVVK